MPQVDLNYMAIFVSVIISMVLGAIWYSPMLFANAWVESIGKKASELEEMRKNAGPGYVVAIISALVTAYVLAHIVDYAGATTAGSGAMTGLWLWLGFIAAPMAMNIMFEGRSWKLFWINAGMQLVNLLIIGAILATWQ